VGVEFSLVAVFLNDGFAPAHADAATGCPRGTSSSWARETGQTRARLRSSTC
jgi:hypothetical protein